MNLLFKLLLKGGAGFSPIADPRFTLVGDSLTQFGNGLIPINGTTLTRDAAGVVTVNKTAHQLFGSQPIYVMNVTDASYEALSTSTYIDANNFIYTTSVTGAAGSTTGEALGQVIVQNRLTRNSFWSWLNSLLGGSARLNGNLGQGGDRLDQMNNAVAIAAANAAEFVIMGGGINDINQAASGATVTSRMQTHITTLLAAGKKVVLLAITPLGSTWPATSAKRIETQAANAGFATIAAANPNSVFYVDIYTPLADPAYSATDGRAYSWVTSDGIHWGSRAANAVAQAIQAVITSKVIVSPILPTSSGNLPTAAGFTAIKEYGAWSGTGGGFNGTNSTGTVQPKLQIFAAAATPTVNSLVDRGAGLGYWQQMLITPGGANNSVTAYIQANGGESLASLGLTTSDTVYMAVEVSWSNGIAAGLLGFQLNCNLNNSGAEGYGRCGEYDGVPTFLDDSGTMTLITGPVKLTGATTVVQSQVSTRVAAATANVLTWNIGRIVLYKKNP